MVMSSLVTETISLCNRLGPRAIDRINFTGIFKVFTKFENTSEINP